MFNTSQSLHRQPALATHNQGASGSNTQAVLTAQHLQFQFGANYAVRDVSLSLYAGELLAMIGPNGAGKSTVFNLIAGDLTSNHPQTSIHLHTQNITKLAMPQRTATGLGRSYQTAAPFTTLTVYDNLRVAASVAPQFATERLAALPQLLLECGLEPLAHHAVQALPYADWKRLDLAMALVQNPKVLLLDEPTAGLAPQARTEMMQWVQQLAIKRQIGVLFTEHNLDAVFAYADRVMVLVRGQTIALGTALEVANNPAVQDAYTGNYQMPQLSTQSTAS